MEGATRLMEELHPHENLKYLEVRNYPGVRIPVWLTSLQNCMEVEIANCVELEYLPCMGVLPRLKVLKLIMLAKLEYIGEDCALVSSSYPSLETLRLENLPKFTGWGSGVGDDHFHQVCDNNSKKVQLQFQLPCFSLLKSLFVWKCPELSSIPLGPKVEEVKLIDFNGRESNKNLGEVSSHLPHLENSSKIKKVAISNVEWLDFLPEKAFQCLETLEIWRDKEVKSLEKVGGVFCSCSSSLKILVFHNCSNLVGVMDGGLENLTALEELELRNCDNLILSGEEKEGEKGVGIGIGIDIMPTPSFHHSLRILKLEGLPKLVNLPDWMQFLPALQTLCISYCIRLKTMSDWMPKLVNLHQLTVSSCAARLEKRCKRDPPGEDWSKIQHIPNIQFKNCVF